MALVRASWVGGLKLWSISILLREREKEEGEISLYLWKVS